MARSRTKRISSSAPVPGYDKWTIGGLRQKLARRAPEELRGLLDYEKGGRKRKGAIDAIKRVLDDIGGGSSKKGSKAKRGSKAKKGSQQSRPVARFREQA